MKKLIPEKVLLDLAKLLSRKAISPHVFGVASKKEQKKELLVCWKVVPESEREINAIYISPHNSDQRFWINWKFVTKWLKNPKVRFYTKSPDIHFPHFKITGMYDGFPLVVKVLSQPMVKK